jgi:hypothetical protein
VQDKSGTPSIVMSGTLSLPTDGFPVVLWFREAIRMEGGVDVITSGTTPGVVDVWVNVEDGK